MTMCAAITVPIIKDGYRLYPGMPVSSQGAQQNSQNPRLYPRDTTMVINNRGGIPQSQTLYFTRQSSASCNNSGVTSAAGMSGSPPEAPQASSPPTRGLSGTNQRPTSATNRIIVGGATGGGVHHQVILLQPRQRTTSAQPSQMTARSSFEVGPTQVWTDPSQNRQAMSTSQLYIQKRRELCIQQQLQKQELARKQQLQQTTSRSDSITSNMSATSDDQRKRKTSQGDPNNNSDSESSNPFRKLLRRLGFGGQSASGAASSNVSQTQQPQQRHVTFESPISIGSDCESGIEQAISVTETPGVLAVSAWH